MLESLLQALEHGVASG
jgi:hypothetical protein